MLESKLDQLIRETWGSGLEALNTPERLLLLKDVLRFMSDKDLNLSEECECAADQLPMLYQGNTREYLNLVKGMTDLLIGYGTPLNQIGCTFTWVDDSIDEWGETLKELSTNEHAYLIYSAIQKILDITSFENYPNYAELEECANWMSENHNASVDESLRMSMIYTARNIAECIE